MAMERAAEPNASNDTTSDPSAPKEAALEVSAPKEAALEPTAPKEGTLEPSAPKEATLGPSDPNEEMCESSAPSEAISDPSAPKEAILEPSAPNETTLHPSAPKEAILEPSAPNETTLHPSAPKEATLEPSGPKEHTSDPHAPKNVTPVPSVPKDTTCEASALKEVAPETSGPQKARATEGDTKVGKVISSVRKNIPPKKDRLDPLKLDMSKPTVMPLSSSQLSLQCMECHIIFSDNKSKERHLKMSHPAEYEQCMLGDALFACYVCDRHFTCSAELMAHQRAHTEKRPFKCPICGEVFGRSSELTLHKKVHFGQHGYTCADCGKPCKTLTLLKYHSRTHTGERPYVCRECGRRFSMPKALQKHLDTHSQDETEGSGPLTNANTQKTRNSGESERKLSCSLCDATFKTAKTQLHHMKHKHSQGKKVMPTSVSAPVNQLKQGPPIVTQAAVGQPTVLRMEAIGQTQQIDTLGTEQLKRLIETLGNVQKVNQLVILGLTHLPVQTQTVQLQQTQGLVQPLRLDFSQQAIQSIELKPTEGETKSLELEQSNSQLESSEPGVSEKEVETVVVSQAQGEGTAMAVEHTEGPVLAVGPQMTQTPLDEVQLELVPVPSETRVTLEQNLLDTDETDPIHNIIRTVEFEQMNGQIQPIETEQIVAQIDSLELGQTSSLTPTDEFEKAPGQDQTVQEEQVLVPMDMMVSEETISQTDTGCLGLMQEPIDSLVQVETQLQTGPVTMEQMENDQGLEQGQLQLDASIEPNDMSQLAEPLPQTCQSSNISQYNQEPSPHTNQSDMIQQSEEMTEDRMLAYLAECFNVKKNTPTKNSRPKKQISENSMTPQTEEQVQEHAQQQIVSKPQANTLSKERPAKHSRAKKGHLVVRFGPREKKGKPSKQKQLNEGKEDNNQGHVSATSQADKEIQLKQKPGKNKKVKGFVNSKTQVESVCQPQEPQVQEVLQVAEQTSQVKPRKRKMKKQSDGISIGKPEQTSRQELILPPWPKKKKPEKSPEKKPLKKTKVKKTPEKELKKKTHKILKQKPTSVPAYQDQIKQQALLLLKGHKQPQLKVHKLDSAKTAGQLEQVSPSQSLTKHQQDPETMPAKKQKGAKRTSLKTANQKRRKQTGKKSKKEQQEASSLLIPPVDPSCGAASSQTKPKASRKRRSPTKMDQEIALSSPYSRRALGCQDCGKKFSEVSALQEHMASMHASAAGACLDHMNGSVSKDHIPMLKSNELGLGNAIHPDAFGMRVATDWDMEVEMGEIGLGDREEQRLSFPALNPSPSLPLAPAFVVEGEERRKDNGEKSMANTAEHLEMFSSGIATGGRVPLSQESTPFSQPNLQVSGHLSESDQVTACGSRSQSLCPPPTVSNRGIQPTVITEKEGHLEDEDKKPENKENMDAGYNALDTLTSVSEPQRVMEEEIKEELLLDVNVVTVGDQSEGHPASSTQDYSHPDSSQDGYAGQFREGSSHNEYNGTPALSPHIQSQEPVTGVSAATTSLNAGSCDTDHPEIKQEEEEILVQRRDEEKREVDRNNVSRGRRRGGGRGRRAGGKKRAAEDRCIQELEPEKEIDDCQVVYQLYSLTNDSEIKDEEGDRLQAGTSTSGACLPASLDSPEEQVVFELESVTTSVVEVVKTEDGMVMEESGELVREAGNSPGLLLERFLTSRGREERNMHQSQAEMRNNGRPGNPDQGTNGVVLTEALRNQEIKVEDNTANLAPYTLASHAKGRGLVVHHVGSCVQRGLQMFLVKEEDSLVLNEPQVFPEDRPTAMEDTETPLTTSFDPGAPSHEDGDRGVDKNREETSTLNPAVLASSVKQCIFFPVKDEEREELLEAPTSEQGISVLMVPGEETLNYGLWCPAEECEEGRGSNEHSSTDGGEVGSEEHNTQDLLEFLSQSSDSEDTDHFNSEPEAEALALSACSHGTQSHSPASRHGISSQQRGGTNSSAPSQETRAGDVRTTGGAPAASAGEDRNGRGKPIDYFTQYFGWDTWEEIARCTAKVSKLQSPTTAKEVAQFAGIHIAMGTLKFPSLKLYWQDCTRVPLIADAMPASRFSELTSKLKLACPGEGAAEASGDGKCAPAVSSTHLSRACGDSEGHKDSHGTLQERTEHAHSTRGHIQCVLQMPGGDSKTRRSNGPGSEDTHNCTDSSVLKKDPLWKVRVLVDKLREGCRALKREGSHGVDQYPMPLGRPMNSKLPKNPGRSLHHTVIISASGLIVDFTLSLDDSNREDTVEKMVCRGKESSEGMVFLCKPELSTPSMLEHLLEAGVRSAGKVGGARGQVGDEFVSSDGKLKLFRCHHGFILSAAGKGHARPTSLVSGFERALKAAHLNRDLRNLYCTPCSNTSPTAWPQSVLWHLTDVALVNSWLLYRRDHGHVAEPLSLMAFRLEVSKALILSSGADAQDSTPPHPPAPKRPSPSTTPSLPPALETPLPDAATRYDGLGHWPEQLAEGEEARCRFGGCERTSRVRCLKCCVFLCISRNHNCFLKFHSQGSI